MEHMTQLELAGGIGNGPMEIAKLYLKGCLSFSELENIFGRDKASLVGCFEASLGSAGMAQTAVSL